MLLRRFLPVSFVLLLAGCATTAPVPRPADVGANVKRVAFVQHGDEPMRYIIGAVDGKTSWAGPSVTLTPGSQAPVDVQASLAYNLMSVVGKKMAEEALKDDPEYYQRLLGRMVGGRKLTSEVAPLVMREMTDAWGVDPKSVELLRQAKESPVVAADGLYLGPATGADLVLAYSIEQLMLSEKPEMSVLWKAVVTAGMYDRPVVPYMLGMMTAFKRDEKGQLRQVMWARCSDVEFYKSSSEQWVVLKEQPEKAAPLLDAGVLTAAQGCKTTLTRLNRR